MPSEMLATADQIKRGHISALNAAGYDKNAFISVLDYLSRSDGQLVADTINGIKHLAESKDPDLLRDGIYLFESLDGSAAKILSKVIVRYVPFYAEFPKLLSLIKERPSAETVNTVVSYIELNHPIPEDVRVELSLSDVERLVESYSLVAALAGNTKEVKQLYFNTLNKKLELGKTTDDKRNILVTYANNVYQTLLDNPGALSYLGFRRDAS